jgi:hypothetical protein
MAAASFDVIMAAAFAVAFFFNRQSIVLLLGCALWELAFLLPVSDFTMSLIGATIYAVLAAAFIRILSSLRYAMLGISCLYYLNAVDFWLSNGYETLYYNSVSYLIGAVELYALWQLMKGSFSRARIHSIVNRGFFHL